MMERLTIDEAIAFCHEKSNNIKLKAEPQVFIQLAEWLEELKELRKIKEDYAKGMQTSYATFMYNKAIDDFVESISLPLSDEDICKIAEQLKAGEQNESK